MDVYKVQPARATVLGNKIPREDILRRPLIPSEKNNAVLTSCRPRTAEVSSRYKSGILSPPASITGTPRRCTSPTAGTPRRCASPTPGRAGPVPGVTLPKRSQSTERRPTTPSSRLSASSHPSPRPSTPSQSSRSTTPVRDTTTGIQARRLLSSRTPDGLWPSMRNLTSSFQSSASLATNKNEKVVSNACTGQTTKSSSNAGTERKKTPLRGRALSEQSENAKPIENSNTRVIEPHRWPPTRGGRLTTNTLSSRSVDLTNKVSRSVSLSSTSQVIATKRPIPPSKSLSEGVRRVGIDGSKRTERDRKSGVNFSSQVSDRASSATWLSRAQSLPTAGYHRPSTPNRVSSSSSSTSRGMPSPIRTRPSTSISSSCNGNIRAGPTSSVLNCLIDVHRGKKNASQIEDCHQLRLLHNAVSQWRFVNALTSETLSIQKMRAENVLYSVWANISVMHDSVIMKRINVQHLQQQMKLRAILNEQRTYLEHWVSLEREHSISLSGAVEALKASTLRLPVTEGARADVRGVKNAVSSTVDVMQAMASSICNLLCKVEGTKTLVSELAIVAEEEKFFLNECRELLASVAAMQVQESSLRTHLVQLKQYTYMA